MNYDHQKIEAFWQAYWAEHQTFKAIIKESKRQEHFKLQR